MSRMRGRRIAFAARISSEKFASQVPRFGLDYESSSHVFVVSRDAGIAACARHVLLLYREQFFGFVIAALLQVNIKQPVEAVIIACAHRQPFSFHPDRKSTRLNSSHG